MSYKSCKWVSFKTVYCYLPPQLPALADGSGTPSRSQAIQPNWMSCKILYSNFTKEPTTFTVVVGLGLDYWSEMMSRSLFDTAGEFKVSGYNLT